MLSGLQLVKALDVYGKIELLTALGCSEGFSSEELKYFREVAKRLHDDHMQSLPKPSEELLNLAKSSKPEAVKKYREEHVCSLRDALRIIEYYCSEK